MIMIIWPFRAVLLAMASLPLALRAESAGLQAGAAKVDITPSADAALPMSGYADRKEGFKGIHDHIYTRAIVFGDGTRVAAVVAWGLIGVRSEEHTSELQSRLHIVCRLLLEKKKKKT